MQLGSRVVVAVLFVSLLGLGRSARAEDAFTAKTQLYIDTDHTTVISPLVAVSRDAWKDGTVSASYVADVVSSASIDVVSNATQHMTDFRSEISTSLAQKLGSATLTGGYIYSVENDYQSHNANVGFAYDLFDKNSTLSLGYGFSANDVYRTGDRLFHRGLMTHGGSASWTQVFDRATIGQLSYTISYGSGYWSSPYRFVRVESPNDLGTIEFKVPESEPVDRIRHAAVVGVNRHLFKETSLQGDYRFYTDSWGIGSHTVQLRYFVTFKDLTLRLRGRFYYQTHASFFRSVYTSDDLPRYVTADRELSTFWSVLGGAKVSWRLPWVHRALELEAKVDYFHFNYIDFALLKGRDGITAEAGLNVIY